MNRLAGSSAGASLYLAWSSLGPPYPHRPLRTKTIFADLPLPELQSRITEMRAAEGDSFRFSKSLGDRVAEIRRPSW